MREWQQTKFKNLVLPDAVYYQSIWAVRDLYRMEEQLELINQEIDSGAIHTTSVVSDVRSDYDRYKPTEEKALEKASLEKRTAKKADRKIRMCRNTGRFRIGSVR